MEETTIWWGRYDSPLGRLCAAMTHSGLTDIALCEEGPAFVKGLRLRHGAEVIEDDAPFAGLFAIFDRYFAGEPVSFNIALALVGTPFEMAVWRALREVPWGATLSYGEVAARLARPHAARAVGAACGANPLPLVVPCHRVIRADGAVGGYSGGGGLEFKRALLMLEGVAPERISSF